MLAVVGRLIPKPPHDVPHGALRTTRPTNCHTDWNHVHDNDLALIGKRVQLCGRDGARPTVLPPSGMVRPRSPRSRIRLFFRWLFC